MRSLGIRSRRRDPYNFEDGLKVRGRDIEQYIHDSIADTANVHVPFIIKLQGDGTTVEFDLTDKIALATPGAKIVPELTEVFVGGIWQDPIGYSFINNNTKISFTEAPVAPQSPTEENISIVVQNFSKITLNEVLAELVDYTAPNTYAQERSAKDKLDEYVTAKDFGLSADTVQNLYSIIGKPGQKFEALGYYVPGDGGGGVFYWDNASAETDNKGTIVQPTALSGNGRWKREFSGPVNIRWFGAKGDGATDDTVSIQKWLDYPGESELASGTFKFTSQLNQTISNKTVRGKGGILKAFGAFSFALVNSANDCKINGIKLDGNNVCRIAIENTGANCDFDDNEIYNLSSTNNLVTGIYSHNTTGRLNIRRNKIHDLNSGVGNATLGDSVGGCRAIYYNGNSTNNLSGFKINDNEIWNISGEEGDAIHVANVSVSGLAPYAKMKGEIYGNRIKDVTRRAIKIQASNVSVLFNKYEHTIGASGNATAVIEVIESEDCIIGYNDIDATAFSYGIAVTRQTGTYQTRGNRVVGNTIENYSGLVNGASSCAVYLNGVQNSLIAHNKLKNGVIQIRLTNASGTRVAFNDAYISASGTGNDCFIYIETTSNDNIINGNIGSGDSGLGPTSGMIKMSGSGNKVIDNHARYDSTVAYVGINLLSGIGTKNIIERNSNISGTQTVYAASTYAGNIILNNFNRGAGSIGIVDTGNHVSADKGDADATLVASNGNTDTTVIWNTALTANRTVTLSTVGAWNGAKLRIVRTTTASGAFNLAVSTLKTLATGQWCEVEYNGTAWVLTAFGSL